MPEVSETDHKKPLIHSSWYELIGTEFNQPYFTELKTFLLNEKKLYKVYPPGSKIFEAFNLTPVDAVKVVILGQDPYHGEGQAHGLCFSVTKGTPLPPSLKNIYKELFDDLNIPISHSGDLSSWATNGVLMMNATLTVRKSTPGSHQGKGWEIFTDHAIEALSNKRKHIVFLLWGKYAQEKSRLIDQTKHLILKAPHPSPFSAHSGFLGCRHFSKTNQWLMEKGIEPVDWKIADSPEIR